LNEGGLERSPTVCETQIEENNQWIERLRSKLTVGPKELAQSSPTLGAGRKSPLELYTPPAPYGSPHLCVVCRVVSCAALVSRSPAAHLSGCKRTRRVMLLKTMRTRRR
jgi:hypothetical protein